MMFRKFLVPVRHSFEPHETANEELLQCLISFYRLDVDILHYYPGRPVYAQGVLLNQPWPGGHGKRP